MIIPTRDAKSYGAVHIDHYLTFTGFCKKVYSDEIQSIDVLIDGQKIDTITCDKTIDKVSKIYDIDGYGFEYDLPEIYFDRRHILSFRCSDSGEELVNSPISTIARDDEKFNEYKFLHSLSKPIDEDKIKDMYCPNSIGFLAIEENLNDTKFVSYIKELIDKFPNVKFIGFYLSNHERLRAEEIFVSFKLSSVLLQNTYQLIQNVSILLLSNHTIQSKLISKLSDLTNCMYIDLSISCSIGEYEKLNERYYKLFLEYHDIFGFTYNDINNYEKSFFCSIYNKFKYNQYEYIKKNDPYTSLYEKRIRLTLTSQEFKEFLLETKNKLDSLYAKYK